MAKTTNSDKIRAASDRSLFLMLDYDFIETPLLTLHEKAVYVVLRKFAGSKDSCFPAVSTIAKQAQVSRAKVYTCLNSLEEKGIIRRENRFNDDTGGRTSNIYTILDKNRIWKAKTLEEMRTAANETELDFFRRRLEQAGYSVTKEKVPTSETGEFTEADTHTQDHHNNDNSENQAKRYKLTDIYDLYQYSGIVQQYPELKDNIDAVMLLLLDALNSDAGIKISGTQYSPIFVSKRLLTLEPSDIVYAIKQFNSRTDAINSPENYMLTLLWKSKYQNEFRITNDVHTDTGM